MRSALRAIEAANLRQENQISSTQKLTSEANSEYHHLTEALEILEIEPQNGDMNGVAIALEEVTHQEEKLTLFGQEQRTRSDYDRERMLEF